MKPAASVLFCNLIQIGKGFPKTPSLPRLVFLELPVDIIALALSAVVNIWATGMIAYRAWFVSLCVTRRYIGD